MTYLSCDYFCPNKDCPNHTKLIHKKGYCLECSSQLERIRYCPNCETKGRPYQNRICYKCGRHLIDYFK